MEKEIIWTRNAQEDFWEITSYLKATWPANVLDRFEKTLLQKLSLVKTHPQIGFKSRKYSRFRKTLITRHYMLIYTVTGDHIVIHRLKHTKQG